MPYPKGIKRVGTPSSFDQLAYQLLRECKLYLERADYSSAAYRDILAALNDVNHEFYRRWGSRWADEAIARNGDI